MDTAFLIINLIVAAFVIFIFVWLTKRHVSFSKRVLLALGIGIVAGFVLQFIYGAASDVTKQTTEWLGIIGGGYIKLLQMIAIPLIFISIVTAFTRLQLKTNIAKVGIWIIGTLVVTAAIAAFVGIGAALLFHLDASNISQGATEAARATELQDKFAGISDLSFPQKIVELLPANPFLDFTGARATSTVAIVIFAAFIGAAFLGVQRKQPKEAAIFAKGVDAIYAIVLRIVKLILRLTPYGVFAIMTSTVALSDTSAILKLGNFVLASYAALIAMFIIHLVIVAFTGTSPMTYIRKSMPVLTLAFTSRTSAGAIPLNIETQKKLGVPEGIANFAASFGLSIGQNGCAGIYPAMLAIMIAPAAGIDPFSINFILTVVLVVAISSFGVAGVGGGATFAAIIVLSTLNLPIGLAGVLISIEPLIDMGRTALNVSDSMVAGIVTSKATGELKQEDDQTLVEA
ncbi:sodium-cystine symporter TcyP [Listeria weihenstephanensis FSL R9-0317]|uniref:L-cystine uptake protein TcyP n=1 Tax=Listeria weihenstephanensis TaxID=1006155 RepID=A0A1S7FTY7_9LIST|nr:cation:dicarboxylase symporter family transporter [Listeria weihenstephanensis]AQY50839.1 sodium:dicarboxylate symporter [Listeria weihenstephanensis]EUJ35192.1 sodium-cystine symporter TcyP [Listeria weihenstephanensis FSL R9-0317]